MRSVAGLILPEVDDDIFGFAHVQDQLVVSGLTHQLLHLLHCRVVRKLHNTICDSTGDTVVCHQGKQLRTQPQGEPVLRAMTLKVFCLTWIEHGRESGDDVLLYQPLKALYVKSQREWVLWTSSCYFGTGMMMMAVLKHETFAWSSDMLKMSVRTADLHPPRYVISARGLPCIDSTQSPRTSAMSRLSLFSSFLHRSAI